MGIIEAQLARAGYTSFDQMIESKAEQAGREELLPAFQAAIGKIRQDETRHIENGRWMMKRLADAEPDVVPEVYEPRMKQYLENKVLSGPRYDEQPFEGYDWGTITEQAQQHLQDTIDYVGADRFDELADVHETVERMQSVSS